MPALQPGLRGTDVSGATTLQSGVDAGAAAGSVGSLSAVSLVAALVYFLYGRRLRDSPDRTAALSRIRRALRLGLPVVYVVALLAMVTAGWLDVVGAAVEATLGGESPASGAFTLVAGLAAPAVAPVAAYFGAFPAVRALREVDVSAATVAVRLGRYAAGMALLFAVVAVAASLAVDGLSTTPGFFGVVLAVALAALAGSPWAVRLVQPTRAPTDAERERLGRLCEDVGFEPRAVRVLEVADAKQAFAFVRGVTGRRHLFVADHLLAELDDDRLRAYLALRAGRARVMHLEVRLAVVVGTVALAGALLAGLVSAPGVGDGAAALLVVAGGTVGLWAGQRLVHRADADAVERTSREAVEAAIRRFADLNDAPMEWGRLTAVRRMEPPLTRRIDRLRDRAARE